MRNQYKYSSGYETPKNHEIFVIGIAFTILQLCFQSLGINGHGFLHANFAIITNQTYIQDSHIGIPVNDIHFFGILLLE